MVKGFVKTLEAGIAIGLILVSMVFLFPQKTKIEPQLSDTAYECLRYLDNRGVLEYYTVNGKQENLISDIRTCLPPLSDFTVKICKTSSCGTTLPYNKTIFLSGYLIAGDNSVNPTLINLWVWSK